MKRPKTLVIAVILLIILLSAEVFVVKKLSNYEPKIKVIYAKTNIPAETLITKEMLIEKEVSISLVSLKAIKDKAEAVGKMARIDIEEMEVVTNSRLMEKIEEKKIDVMDANNRLFTVEFKADQINGWWVEDKVDIIFIPDSIISTYLIDKNTDNTKVNAEEKENKSDDKNENTSLKSLYNLEGIIRLENIRVAAIIDENRQLIEKIEDTTYRPILASFEVSTMQDEFLAWAKHNGKIEVSIRKLEGER